MLIPRVADRVLQDTTDILDKMKVPYWIDSGTLLGAYRDNNINYLDHDIDIRVLESGFSDKQATEFVGKLWDIGYNLIDSLKPPRTQILAFHRQKVLLDFKFCYEEKGLVWYYCWAEPNPQPMLHVFPSRFFKDRAEIELLGKKYPCPNPVEDYIVHHYGPEWKLFKVRKSEANETDLSWDYMHDSPASMTAGKLALILGKELAQEDLGE